MGVLAIPQPTSGNLSDICSDSERIIIRSQIPLLVRYTFMISILNVPQSPPILQSFDAVYISRFHMISSRSTVPPGHT